MLTVTEAFVVVPTAEEAVDRLAALHERATGRSSQALKRYLKDRIEPTPSNAPCSATRNCA
jgi:AMP nucleosidase